MGEGERTADTGHPENAATQPASDLGVVGGDEVARDLAVEEVSLDSSLSSDVIKDIVRGEKASSRNGLLAGLAVILLGAVLLLAGVSGAVDITFAGGGANGHIVTSAIGVIVVLLGGAIIYATRYKVVTNPVRKDPGHRRGR